MPKYRKYQYVKLQALIEFCNNNKEDIKSIGFDNFLRKIQSEMNLTDGEITFIINKVDNELRFFNN